MNRYKAKGVILHAMKYGDNSLIVHILTDVMGRQAYIVKGVKGGRSKSNKLALLQPMFLVGFEGAKSKYGDLHTIRDLHLSTPLRSLPFDPIKSTISMFMSEVICRLVREEERNIPFFDFLSGSVLHLDQLDSGVYNFHLWFLVQLSSYLGFYPGNEYFAGSCFDIKEGIFVEHFPEHMMAISIDNSKLLGSLMDCELSQLSEIGLGRRQRSDFMTDLLGYFDYHLDGVQKIKSVQILKEVF